MTAKNRIQKDIEFFWMRLSGIFDGFLVDMSPSRMMLKHSIGVTCTDVFLLRAYLAFMADSDGDEISITIDVKAVNSFFIITSDIVSDEGRIIAGGPSLECRFTSWPEVEIECEKWFKMFEIFLSRSHAVMIDELSKLK
jgi:hypothetical protein